MSAVWARSVVRFGVARERHKTTPIIYTRVWLLGYTGRTGHTGHLFVSKRFTVLLGSVRAHTHTHTISRTHNNVHTRECAQTRIHIRTHTDTITCTSVSRKRNARGRCRNCGMIRGPCAVIDFLFYCHKFIVLFRCMYFQYLNPFEIPSLKIRLTRMIFETVEHRDNNGRTGREGCSVFEKTLPPRFFTKFGATLFKHEIFT